METRNKYNNYFNNGDKFVYEIRRLGNVTRHLYKINVIQNEYNYMDVNVIDVANASHVIQNTTFYKEKNACYNILKVKEIFNEHLNIILE